MSRRGYRRGAKPRSYSCRYAFLLAFNCLCIRLTAYVAGDRCEVDSEDGSLARRGVVGYVGKVDFGTGYWVR